MQEILGFISSYKISGVVPLDLVCHLIVGTIWTGIGVYKDIDLKSIFIGLVIIAATKEANDYLFHLPSPITEYLYDFLISFVFLVILWTTRKLKAKIDKKEAPVEKWKIY
jgi:hypothetical protein